MHKKPYISATLIYNTHASIYKLKTIITHKTHQNNLINLESNRKA